MQYHTVNTRDYKTIQSVSFTIQNTQKYQDGITGQQEVSSSSQTLPENTEDKHDCKLLLSICAGGQFISVT